MEEGGGRRLLEEFAGSRARIRIFRTRVYVSRGGKGEEDGENDDDSNSKVIKINLLLPVLFVPSLPSLSSLVVVETLKREETIRV